MDTNSELKDNQIGCFWLPTTPAKPNSTKHQPICTNWQENLSVQANQWVPNTQAKQVAAANSSEAGKLVADFLQEAQHQSLHPFYGSKDPNNISSSHVSNSQTEAVNMSIYDDNLRSLDTMQPCTSTNNNACGEDPSMNNKFLIDDMDKWTNMSFGDLLALAQGSGNLRAENVVAQTDFVATNITSSFQLHPLDDARQYKMSLGSSSITQIESGLATESEARLNNIPDMLTDGSSIPSRPFFDINMPMRMTTDTSSNNTITSLFEPITPEKTNKTGRRSAVQDFRIDEVPAAEEKHENNTGSKEVQESLQKKELSQLAADQLCATTSTQGQENHKPDKGDTEEAHLIKTPQQKPRRKKHRPKVIIEGQRQSTPKQKSEKNGNLQETTRVKRKYTRRKGIENPTNIPLEIETSETYSVNNAPNTEDSPVRKRKYARRKGINKHDDNMDRGTPEAADIKTSRHTRSSCRRSLNFNSETQVGDEDSPYGPTSSHGMEARENFDPKDQTGHVELIKNDPMRTGQSGCTRGKCQIVFSDFTHDKEANIPQVKVNPNGRWTPKSPDGSICSNTCLPLERQARGLKRQNTGTTAEAECSNKNATGMFYNSLQAYRSIFSQNADIHNIAVGMHFPAICKKKRTQKGHSTATSSMQSARTASENQVKYENEPLRDSCMKLFRSNGNQGPSVAQCKDANLLMHNPATDVIQIQNQRQIFQSLLALGPAERIRKKRSKVPTRVRDLASLIEICKELPASASGGTTSYRTEQAIDILHKPHTCMETLVAVTHSTVTKKRSKRNMQIKSTVQNLYNHQQFATNSIAFNTGPRLAITWKSASPIDLIIQQLNQLDLSADVSQVSAQKQNALMAYHMHYQQMGALVPYQRGGAVVPFDSSFNQVRRRRPRPKVELDDETTRVWKLLLENINSEGIDGTDEEKAQWWEEERKVFVGRADSFIARMHLIQGDRRFSPWKGSVIDSVVGVFLTQNVSDHLSSSAFMSLAAKFPLQSKANIAESDDENVDTEIIEPGAFGLDLNERFELKKEVLNKPVCGEDTEMAQDFQENEIKVNSAKSSGKDFDNSVPKDSLAEQHQDIYKQHPLMSHESAEDGLTRLVEDIRDTDEALSSQTSVISSQNSADSPVGQSTERNESFLQSTSAEKPISGVEPDRFTSASFLKLLQMAGNVIHGVYEECCEEKGSKKNEQMQSGSSERNSQNEDNSEDKSCDKSTSSLATNSGEQAAECFDWSEENSNFSDTSSAKLCTTELSELSTESESQTMSMKFKVASFEEGQSSGTKSHSINDGQIRITKQIVQNQTGHVIPQIMCQENNYKTQEVRNIPSCPQNFMDVRETSGNIDNSRKPERKEVKSSNIDPDYNPTKTVNVPKARGRPAKQKQNDVDWDCLRKEAQAGGKKREKTANTMDSVDWDAVRCSDVNEIAQTIKERGMNNMLAERIKDFLNRLVKDHGSIDLEWLRDVPPDKAKEYLLSIRGLGLKSVECVRLLTLHHLAFPVDTNVGRIAVRLGWVPLQPLPESLQLHLLELYPVLESIQKYLWPRLCKLDQRTLYELHYQMITFGKVFCTKSKPNCNACPMRAECRHFASAFASARLALPAPEEKSITIATANKVADQNPIRNASTMQLPSLQANQTDDIYITNHSQPIIEEPATPEPIIEVPASPEPAYTQVPECYTENTLEEDPDEIPTIQLNMEEFTQNLQKIMQQKTEMHEGDLSKALIALSTEAASIPVPKLKNVSQLRTEHQVYELPDSHPLLERMDKREPDDPCPYLLAIWTPGETVDSTEPPQRMCSSTGSEKLCTEETCLSCNSFREACSQTVRGTLLIPCRTAMRGSFPLNGTYFQVNEVFSDHESSLVPMDIPREWLWNLPRRTVYFGTSIPTIFKGLSTEGIQYCFWRGFVCVRGFDRKTRAPRPLIARLHFPASKRAKGKWKTDDN